MDASDEFDTLPELVVAAPPEVDIPDFVPHVTFAKYDQAELAKLSINEHQKNALYAIRSVIYKKYLKMDWLMTVIGAVYDQIDANIISVAGVPDRLMMFMDKVSRGNQWLYTKLLRAIADNTQNDEFNENLKSVNSDTEDHKRHAEAYFRSLPVNIIQQKKITDVIIPTLFNKTPLNILGRVVSELYNYDIVDGRCLNGITAHYVEATNVNNMADRKRYQIGELTRNLLTRGDASYEQMIITCRRFINV